MGDPGLMPTRQLDKAEMSEPFVRQAIDSLLMNNQRMALLISSSKKMSYADIGETMGLSVSRREVMLWRARESACVRFYQTVYDEGSRPKPKIAQCRFHARKDRIRQPFAEANCDHITPNFLNDHIPN